MAIRPQRGGGCGRGTFPSHRCVKLISLLTVRFTVSHASMFNDSVFGEGGRGAKFQQPPPLYEGLTNDEK